MADGRLTAEIGSTVNVDGKITASLVMTCVVAASSGLIFGYDIGISGGVTMMVPFLQKFFPSVIRKASDVKTNMYCVYNSQALTAFTSSLYVAGLVASLLAGRLTAKFGRRATITLGGFTFLAGAAVNASAANVAMLISGRILLGFGVGFTNQAAPVYLSEVAPPRRRGAFAAGFQFFIGVGVVAASCVNYAAAGLRWGWRLSLGLAAAPAAIMTVGSLLISDTPTSLLARGRQAQARAALRRLRGGEGADVEAELAELVETSRLDEAAGAEPFWTVLERRHRPHLVVALTVPFFQQVTGINVIAFYAPVLFRSVGFGSGSALTGAIILGLVNLGSILVSTMVVDRFGRRFLFIVGGVQMFICQVTVAAVLAAAAAAGAAGDEHIPRGYAAAVLTTMNVYAAGFGWSWGPLSWLVPSEVFPARIRPAGQSISVAVNFAATFVLSQTFLATLCGLKYGVFLFYGGWIAVMTAFVAVFLPETKEIRVDLMNRVWEEHWYWKRFVRDDNVSHGKQ